MGPVDFIAKHMSLKSSDKKKIAASFNQQNIEKGAILLKESSHARHLYFLEEGFVRSFYNREDGLDKTHWIYGKEDFFTSWYSFFLGKTSFETLEAITPVKLYSISLSNYEKLYENNIAFNGFINAYYQNILAEMDFLSKSFSQFSAKEKYQHLLENNPELIREIKLGVLASWLDISQETLSRVRKNI